MPNFSWKSFLAGFAVASLLFAVAWRVSDSQRKLETHTVVVAASPAPSLECPAIAKEELIPLLPAPAFSEKTPVNLETNYEGEVRVKWRPVLGAKYYVISLEDPDGKQVKNYTATGTDLYMKNIPIPSDRSFALYRIRLGTVNARDQLGPLGGWRTLHAKRPIDLAAPSIKEIKVED